MSAIIEAAGLVRHFSSGSGLLPGRKAVVRALDGVSFSVAKGESVGLVGESGCGKSTLGRLVLRLDAPTAGKVLFRGRDISGLGGAQLKEFRKSVQVVFQDPYGSLNPRLRIGTTVGEGLKVHSLVSRRAVDGRVGELLELVGLPRDARLKYPHEFSGGQRQRVGIARALAVEPEFIVADEPVSSLDVSVRAQIMNLMLDIQERLGLGYLFIAHDLAVVEFIATRIMVMYMGKIVEHAPKAELSAHHLHPYTRLLYSSIPGYAQGDRKEKFTALEPASPRSAVDVPAGCRFNPRCPLATDRCRAEEPALLEKAPGHFAACHIV